MGRLIVNNSLAEVKTVFLVANIVYCILISTKYESTTSTEKHAPNKPEVPLWRDTTSLRHKFPVDGIDGRDQARGNFVYFDIPRANGAKRR
jgi:hypothetical protein